MHAPGSALPSSGRGHGLLALGVILLSAIAVRAQEPQDVLLHAATAAGADGAPEVRLRWQIRRGWIPSDGFSVYQISSQSVGRQQTWRKGRLIANIPQPTEAQVRALLADAGDIEDLWTRAMRNRPGAVVEFTTPRPPSAAGAFVRLRADAERIRAAAAVERPGLRWALRDAERSAVTGAQRPAADPVRNARAQLQAMALLRDEYARGLGLGATDRSVGVGDEVIYGLFTGRGSAERLLAHVRITVGADPMPPVPTGLDAVQVENAIRLRWVRPDPADQSTLLAASWFVDRLRMDSPPLPALLVPGSASSRRSVGPDPRQPLLTGGKLLNPRHPIIILDGDREPIAFFTDLLEPGDIDESRRFLRYRIRRQDGFGRLSEWSTGVTVEAEDWRAPAAPLGASARLAITRGLRMVGGRLQDAIQGSVQNRSRPLDVEVAWIVDPVPGMPRSRFELRRMDDEVAGAAWAPVTPVEGVEGERIRTVRNDHASWIAAAGRFLAADDVDHTGTNAEALRRIRDALNGTYGLDVDPAVEARQFEYRIWRTTERQDRSVRYAVLALATESGLYSSAAVETNQLGIPEVVCREGVPDLQACWRHPPDRLPRRLIEPALVRDIAPRDDLRVPLGSLADLPGWKSPGGFEPPRPQPPLMGAPSGQPGRGGVQGPGRSGPVLPGDARGIGPGTGPLPREGGPPGAPATPDLTLRRLTQLTQYSAVQEMFAPPAIQIQLNWNSRPALAKRDMKYAVRRRIRTGNQVGPWFDVGLSTPSPDGVQVVIDSLPMSHARTVEYGVRAMNRWGVYGTEALRRIELPSSVVPAPPILSSAVPHATQDASVEVRWRPNASRDGVTMYRVVRRKVRVPAEEYVASGEVSALTSPPTDHEYVHTVARLEPGVEYEFAVQAVVRTVADSPAGRALCGGLAGAPSGELTSERSIPVRAVPVMRSCPAPTRALAVRAGENSVEITWTSVPGAVAYMVQRRIRRDGPSPTVSVAPRLESATTRGRDGRVALTMRFVDVNALDHLEYVYEILATDAWGNVSQPATVMVSPVQMQPAR